MKKQVYINSLILLTSIMQSSLLSMKPANFNELQLIYKKEFAPNRFEQIFSLPIKKNHQVIICDKTDDNKTKYFRFSHCRTRTIIPVKFIFRQMNENTYINNYDDFHQEYLGNYQDSDILLMYHSLEDVNNDLNSITVQVPYIFKKNKEEFLLIKSGNTYKLVPKD